LPATMAALSVAESAQLRDHLNPYPPGNGESRRGRSTNGGSRGCRAAADGGSSHPRQRARGCHRMLIGWGRGFGRAEAGGSGQGAAGTGSGSGGGRTVGGYGRAMRVGGRTSSSEVWSDGTGGAEDGAVVWTQVGRTCPGGIGPENILLGSGSSVPQPASGAPGVWCRGRRFRGVQGASRARGL